MSTHGDTTGTRESPTPPPAGEEPPESPDEPAQRHGTPSEPQIPAVAGRELRIALAMRGGVSLAVWIGGAVAELDLARRAMAGMAPQNAAGERGKAYAALIGKAGYTSLAFDVLAGASAGGLNSMIYGYAQSIGRGLESLRGVWEESGDLWKLFHAQWAAGKPFRTEAVLDADRSFYLPLLAALQDWLPRAGHAEAGPQAPEPDPAPITDHLTIDLAATLQSGPPLPDRRTGEDLRPRTAHFRFRRTLAPGGAFNDLPRETDGSMPEEYLRQLAYAARATSSFPGAFEPAAAFSWAGLEPRPAPPEDGDRPQNLRNVFSEVGAGPESSFDVMDGGVFDNIPIARALQAIADAPAGRPTKRILIYLDPSPPVALPSVPAPTAYFEGVRQLRARFFRSVFTALRYKQTVESSTDDLREIGELRKALDDRQLRRRAFIAASPVLRDPTPPDGPLRARLKRYRATSDAARIVDLMTEPGLGFLQTLVPPPAPATALGLSEADAARDGLVRELKLPRESIDLAADATSLGQAADLMIAWIRSLQDLGASTAGPPPQPLADAKAKLYRVRTAALFVRQSRDRSAALAALGDGTVPDPDGDLPFAAMATCLRPAPATGAPDGPDLDSDQQLWDAVTAIQPGSGDVPEADLQSLEAAGWTALCTAVNSLTEALADNPILCRLAPGGAPVAALDTARAQQVTVHAVVAIGETGTVAVPAFFQITGDELPPEYAQPVPLAKVTRAGRALELCRLASSPAGTPPTRRSAVNADAKLAGVQLANFGGFLSAQWRTHDWNWGRADGGAGLLRILGQFDNPDTAPGAPKLLCGTQEFDDARAEVRDLYVGLDKQKPMLTDLTSARLYALVARFGLGLQRALWPLTPRNRNGGARTAAAAMLPAAALILLRPVLVVLPLLVRWPVLLGLGLAAAFADHLARAHTEGESALPPGLLVLPPTALGVLALLQLLGTKRRRAAWQSLTPSAGPDSQIIADVRARLRCAFWVNLALLAACVAAIFVVTTAMPQTQPWSGFEAWTLAVAAGGVSLALGRVRGTALRASTTSPWLTSLRGGALLVGAGVVVWLGGQLVVWWPLLAEWSPLATALVVTGVVAAVHHAWSPPAWMIGAALGAGAITWLVLASPLRKLDWLPQAPGLTALLAILLPLLVAVAVFVVSLGWSRWSVPGKPPFVALIGLVLVAVTVVGTLLLTQVWPWLQSIPLGLVLGCSVAAATTLTVPFRDAGAVAPE